MSDIEDQAAERVAKAKMINTEVLKRLKQPLVPPNVKGTKPKAAPKA
jgi:hypothetical protein